MYTISVFVNRENFVALYLGLQKYPHFTLKQLEQIIKRSKNPPVSVLYTYELLKIKSASQYALDIIRFVSQLADLSKGTSIAQSLEILEEGNFLSQIRHSLTHKTMVSDQLILKARQLILKQLAQKYWKKIYQQMIEQKLLDEKKIEQQCIRIYGQPIQFQRLKEQYIGRVQLIQMKNYQFKKKVKYYIRAERQIQQIVQLFEKISQFKRSIFLSQLLAVYCQDFKSSYYFELIIRILTQNLLKSQTLKQKYILKKLKKIYFFKFLGNNKKIIQIISPQLLNQIMKPFRKAQNQGFIIFQ